MAEHNFHENLTEYGETKVSSNRSFGVTFATVFTILAVLPLLKHNSPHFLLLLLAVTIIGVTFLKSDLLTLPNKYWSKLGLLLGMIMTPVILGLMFYAILTPMALLLRCFGKDLLSRRLRMDQKTYWVERSPPGPEPESLRQQF